MYVLHIIRHVFAEECPQVHNLASGRVQLRPPAPADAAAGYTDAAAGYLGKDTTLWHDPSAFLKTMSTTSLDPLLRSLQQGTLSMAVGRDAFPALFLASLPRMQQVRLHRGFPDCVFFTHSCNM